MKLNSVREGEKRALREDVVRNEIRIYYKTLRIDNVSKIDRLCTKLVSWLLSVTFTGLHEQTSLVPKRSIFHILIMVS
jgi:hypothetical protein